MDTRKIIEDNCLTRIDLESGIREFCARELPDALHPNTILGLVRRTDFRDDVPARKHFYVEVPFDAFEVLRDPAFRGRLRG